MPDNIQLAELLFPDVRIKPEDIFERYPPRKLPSTAVVARFAPSPTGMLHIGTLYSAFIDERLAHQSGGVFYLRIEDTDKKREVTGSAMDIVECLEYFGINYDEGVTGAGTEKGIYGPYVQSARRDIYRAFVKELVQKGRAYPCFCSQEELDSLRKRQKTLGVKPGYYGKWAECRSIAAEQAEERVKRGEDYVIRLKAPYLAGRKLTFTDLIKGDIRMPANDQDIVLLKSDGMPTYHFAHIIDDSLMGTTHVLRGDEWLPSVPVHLQLFEVLGLKAPLYGHIAPIMKKEGSTKRKYSKRKDMDAAAGYYRELGYPGPALAEYFLNLINPDFEAWRASNPLEPYTGFKADINKMGTSGAVFDLDKLNGISRNFIASLSAEEVFQYASGWAAVYDGELYELMNRDRDFTLRVLNIERVSEKPGKNFCRWSDIREGICYFYDELFYRSIDGSYAFPPGLDRESIMQVISGYKDAFKLQDDKRTWFEKIRDLAQRLGYSRDVKAYKANPGGYKGHVGDVAAVIRIALTNRANTPDLYEIMQVLGEDRVMERLKRCLS